MKKNKCKKCNGEGYFQFSVNPDDGALCDVCNGEGLIVSNCPCCDGTGIIEGEHYDDLESCLTCGGSGNG